MTLLPLLNFPHPPLPRRLTADLRMERIFSENALSLLCRPCDEGEIRRRQQLFARMEEPPIREAIARCLAALDALELACLRLNKPAPTLSIYRLHAKRMAAYLEAYTCLARAGEMGELFAETAAYFSAPKTEQMLSHLRRDLERLEQLLLPLSRGMLAVGDGYRLYPDGNSVTEEEELSACITALGLTPPTPHTAAVPLPPSLSDAILTLHPTETAEIEQLLARWADTDFLAPTTYIPTLKFFLEIHSLTERAAARGIPHTLPDIAPRPRYCAEGLCDISLMGEDRPIIPNNAHFTEDEPLFFLIGANGGGKTTYLRALGINLLLFGAGCPVFARSACIYPFPRTDAHFPADERFIHTGRLEEERRRAAAMLEESAGGTAFLLFNETFSGTDDEKGLSHLHHLAADVAAAGHFGLCVTHFPRIADTAFPILTPEVDQEQNRTFRIVRVDRTASSHANHILRRYGLDAESLEKRRSGHED